MIPIGEPIDPGDPLPTAAGDTDGGPAPAELIPARPFCRSRPGTPRERERRRGASR